ncbi:rhomboid family intramembrane serine protease [soil metagenome]
MALPLRDDRPARRTPWVNYGLLLANIVVFLFVQPAAFQGGGLDEDLFDDGAQQAVEFVYRWGVVPCEVQEQESLADGADCGGDALFGAPDPEDKSVPASLFTHLFLHAGLLHIAGNMLFLWIFGNNVEDRLGHLSYLVFYLLVGVIAMLGHSLANFDDAIPAIGASGAISVVMGAYVLFRPRDRILAAVPWFVFQVVYIPAYAFLGLYFVVQFFTPNDAGIAWVAHAAGMAAGLVFAFALRRHFPDPYDHRPPPPDQHAALQPF